MGRAFVRTITPLAVRAAIGAWAQSAAGMVALIR
jgi:hypothetical protein